jgi:hypothetical protein
MAIAERNLAQSPAELRTELMHERARLAEAMEELRASMDLRRELQPRLPLALAAAFVVGFVVSGGIGATMRLVWRRRREGHTMLRLGRHLLVER